MRPQPDESQARGRSPGRGEGFPQGLSPALPPKIANQDPPADVAGIGVPREPRFDRGKSGGAHLRRLRDSISAFFPALSGLGWIVPRVPRLFSAVRSGGGLRALHKERSDRVAFRDGCAVHPGGQDCRLEISDFRKTWRKTRPPESKAAATRATATTTRKRKTPKARRPSPSLRSGLGGGCYERRRNPARLKARRPLQRQRPQRPGKGKPRRPAGLTPFTSFGARSWLLRKTKKPRPPEGKAAATTATATTTGKRKTPKARRPSPFT